MNAQQLRASILQMAIEGRLVPQDPNEKPVEIDSKDIVPEEEQPFAIPENWRWVRLYEVISKASQKVPDRDFLYIDVGSIRNDTGQLGVLKKLKSSEAPSRARKIVNEGNVLYSTVRPYLLNTCVAENLPEGEEIIASTGFAVMAMKPCIEEHYLHFLLRSEFFSNFVKEKQKGVAYPAINEKDFMKAGIPLPPLTEQKRIVTRIEELMPLVETYGEAQEHLAKLDKELPDKMKQSILQTAIQGKLVPQDPNDKPVEIDSKDVVPEEEQPFAIPENWRWCKLNTLTGKLQYGYTASAKSSGIVKFLRITDITSEGVNWETVPFCEIEQKDVQKFRLEDNDILIARTGGTIGKSFCVRRVIEPAVFASYLIRLRVNSKSLYIPYLVFYLNSPWYWEQLKEKSRGTGQPNVNAKSLGDLLLPIPPVSEQERIVNHIEDLFKEIDSI